MNDISAVEVFCLKCRFFIRKEVQHLQQKNDMWFLASTILLRN